MDLQEESKREELVGGIRNALERGSDIVAAQKSFVNAGYAVQEVAAAARKVAEGQGPQNISQQRISSGREQKTPKKSSRKWFWVLLIASGIILIGALLLGLFWDKLS